MEREREQASTIAEDDEKIADAAAILFRGSPPRPAPLLPHSSEKEGDVEMTLRATARDEEETRQLLGGRSTEGPSSLVTAEENTKKNLGAALLLATTGLLFMDQNLMAPNLTQIAKDLDIPLCDRDWELGGKIGMAFFLLGAPATLLIGVLADMMPRIKLFMIVLLIGELPVLMTIFVTTYKQLFVLRALTGIAVGGAVPLTLSLISDMFPPSKRSAVSGMWGIATGGGVLMGQAMAGFIGPAFGWRMPFLCAAAPAIGLSCVLYFKVEEPKRGASEAALRTKFKNGKFSYKSTLSWTKVKRIFFIPTNVLGFLQGIPGCVPWSTINTYLNDYLAQDRGMGVAAATSILLFFGAGGAVGGFGGGLLGQRIYK